MEGSRLTRYFRIALTALSLTACVLLIVLWVRSYWWMDTINSVPYRDAPVLAVDSCQGRLVFMCYEVEIPTWSGEVSVGCDVSSYEIEELALFDELPEWGGAFGFNLQWQWGALPYIAVPHWFLAGLLGTIGLIPWLPWSKRFSLRTLLIATTLVAVALAMIVVMRRN
jgi:hypothetical protein